MGLVDWWHYTGMVTKVLVVAGIAAIVVLALALIAPHVQPLKPIAQSLGLIEVVNHTVIQYQVVNHTVTVVKYINRTVPIYINSTVYVNRTVYIYVPTPTLSEYYGVCGGRIVVLPNGTGWLVMFMLINPRQYTQYWQNGLVTLYTNASTHYAQFVVGLGPASAIFVETNYAQLSLTGGISCYTMNYTINGYWPVVCGDTGGSGPFTLNGVNATTITSTFGANTTQTVLLYIGGIGVPGGVAPASMYMPCQLAITYAPSPTAALWLPVTTNDTLLNYLREGGVEVFGYYDPYDWTMGYWVWDTPS